MFTVITDGMIVIPEIGVITITDTIITGGMVHVITMADMDIVGNLNSAPILSGLFISVFFYFFCFEISSNFLGICKKETQISIVK